MDINLIIFFVAILVLGIIVFAIIISRSKASHIANPDKYRSAWLKVEQQIDEGNQPSYHLAILNADKLLDKALKERGFNGKTMGERMKAAEGNWSNANHVWTAHKLRNRIAHETDVEISFDITKRALGAFKQGLKDLGAI